MIYPLVNIQKAIENGHRNSGKSLANQQQMTLFSVDYQALAMVFEKHIFTTSPLHRVFKGDLNVSKISEVSTSSSKPRLPGVWGKIGLS